MNEEHGAVDLHTHTIYSDGTSTPREVVILAKKQGLRAIAITDHDSTGGIAEAVEAGREEEIEIIPGVELSVFYDSFEDLHILGYFIDCSSPIINEELTRMRETRIERIKNMIQKLKTQGIDNIDFNEVSRLTQSHSIGRPHLAAVLKEKGWVASIPEAFEKYIGENCPAYVSKYKISSYEAISLIQKSGGIAVLAHPMVTNRDELIPGFVEAGLQGIEVYYPNYSEATIRYYEGIAQKHKLITTGGSDAHGEAKANTFIGKVRVPYEIVERLKERLKGSID